MVLSPCFRALTVRRCGCDIDAKVSVPVRRARARGRGCNPVARAHIMPALGLVKDAVTPCARQLFASVGYGEGPAAVIASFERGVLVLLGLSAWVRIVRDFAQCP
jgi:hypothetical protein